MLNNGTDKTPGSLIVVTCTSGPGSNPDKRRVTVSAYQVDRNGRPVVVNGKRVTIPDNVEEFDKGGSHYDEMQGEIMAHATRFETSGVAVPEAPVALPGPAA